jgi:phosphoribosylglycinamide formyltransferase 1
VTSRRTRLGVLVSGAGTNLEALLRACERDDFPAEVVLVVSNRRNARALDIARASNITAEPMPQSAFGNDPAARDRAVIALLRDAQVELVVCAGYDRILSDEFLSAFPDAILNVHPSLLPAFAGGMHAVEDALAYGVKVTGCTIQLLDHGQADGGPIILQAAVPVHPDDDVESLRARIHEQEWQLLPRVVELWSNGELRREGRIVRIHAKSASTV